MCKVLNCLKYSKGDISYCAECGIWIAYTIEYNKRKDKEEVNAKSEN
jgi:hypothetical protein